MKAYRAEARGSKRDAEDGTAVPPVEARGLEAERDIVLRKEPHFD
jgi:hypothetical protein